MTPSNSVHPKDYPISVLIVEDDELTSERLTALLADVYIPATPVKSIHEARQAMRAVHFPILILDRKLGDEDGIDLLREYRSRANQRPVFIMVFSSLDSPPDVAEGMAAGADAYFWPRLCQRTKF